VKSIELVEIYFEPVLITLESAQERIRKGISQIFALCSQYFAFFSDKGRSMKKVTRGIDRARRDLLGTSKNDIETILGANPERYF
jgi:hypothetical protein